MRERADGGYEPTKPERRLRRILARRRRKLEGPWPVRLWKWLRSRFKRQPEAWQGKWPRWSAPPMGSEPATPAAKRAAELRALGKGIAELQAEIDARSRKALRDLERSIAGGCVEQKFPTVPTCQTCTWRHRDNEDCPPSWTQRS